LPRPVYTIAPVTGDGEDQREKRVPPPNTATESTTAVEASDLTPIPAGWYTDPDEPTTRRYWDGDEWTDKTCEQNLGGKKSSKNDTLVTIGWITAVFIPIVGLILGIVANSRGDKRGTYVIICSIVVFALSIALIAATGNN
jgi:hypothetical protein